MSSQLFAFNVSKKTEYTEQQVDEQWVGNGTTLASHCTPCLCTSQNYGFPTCLQQGAECTVDGHSGYYICDPIH